MEHRVVMLSCAHTTMCTEIFACMLIFAQRSSNVFWYLPYHIFARPLIFAHSRYSHVSWYLLLDLCASSDIGPQIFAWSLIFAQRSSDVFSYLPKDFYKSDVICPQIFAYLLKFAQRSLHVFWYLPTTDLYTSADIWPKIFSRLLILAHRSSDFSWYLPKDLCTSVGIYPQIFASTDTCP